MTTICLTPLEYETRNLGMASFAVTDEYIATPDSTELKTTLATVAALHDRLFIQAKLILPQHSTAQHVLAAHGFMFAETALSPYCRISHNSTLHAFRTDRQAWLPRRSRNSELEIGLLERTSATEQAAVSRIAGESFNSDRFHLDPNCPPGAADRRYVLWVEDLLRSDATFHLIRCRGEIIGFLVRTGQRLLLAGFARKYAMSGLGDFFWLSVLDAMASDGIELATTQISANNLPVLNMYARLGFKFRDATALFHYWRL